MKKILLLTCFCLTISSCNSKEENINSDLNSDSKIEVQAMAITCGKMKDEVNDGAILIDVRSKEEYDLGHIDGAVNISVDVIETNISDFVENKESVVILYCQSGNRSKQASQSLIDLGYSNVYDLGSINNCNEY